MTKPKVYWMAGLILLMAAATGCGQKGPLYLDDTSDATVERATPEEEERQKELEGLDRRNESQPEITY